MAGTAVPFGTSATTDDLFLKFYTGEFNAAPQSGTFLYNTGAPGIYRKTVTEGKSWQFLMEAWDPAAEDFDPGNQLLGQSFEEAEGTITPDKYLVAHHKIPKDEMHRSHFEVLSRRAKQHRGTLERLMDRRICITAALAARASASTGTRTGATIHNGGNRVTRAGSSAVSDTAIAAAYPRTAAGALNFLQDVRQLARQMDEDNIPDGPQNRGLLLTPYIRDVLQFDSTGHVWSKDFISDGANNMRREVQTLCGFQILGYPNKTSGSGPMPNENFTTGLSKYQANFLPGTSQGTPVALALCNSMDASAVGLVTFEEIKHEVVYLPDQLCYLVMSYTYAGVGQMHPWAAGSIEVSNT